MMFLITEDMENTQMKEFECVEFTDVEQEDQNQEKSPRRVIRFSSGETMEEYSTEEEEDDQQDNTKEPREREDLLSSVDTSKLQWGPYVHFHMWRAATSTLSACDFMGERVASLFGITTATDQYGNDEQNHNKTENEDEVDVLVSQDIQSHIVEPWNKRNQAEKNHSRDEKMKDNVNEENLSEEIQMKKMLREENLSEEIHVVENRSEENLTEKIQAEENRREENLTEKIQAEENRREENLTEEIHVEETRSEENLSEKIQSEENQEQQMFQPHGSGSSDSSPECDALNNHPD
ncbi:protein FAM177A1-like isoform X2 [Trichomycterus rosablanca]|uniref:protein FAM177A1-like isoform X2 n=1 Tax=Trichomycterus rosablanca TaxID=2290929 RepID=UPI002F351617